VKILPAILLCATVLAEPGESAAQTHSHDHTSPYADLTNRRIKALSEEEIEGLRAGEGMGLALAAELNGLPGPRHVLDMGPMLGLSPEQESTLQEIFREMHRRAVEIGEGILALEEELDRAFAEGSISENHLGELLDTIGGAKAELRFVHLRAHLQTVPVLSDAQIQRYRELRGYTGRPTDPIRR